MDDQIIQVTTCPFGASDSKSSMLLDSSGFDIRYNPFGRRIRPEEVGDVVVDANGIIAGTEPYTRQIIENCPDLKIIARVGVGFDSIDLQACRDNDVIVTYTPEAPADAVADLTVGQIINLLRGIYISNESVRNGFWKRIMGKLVSEIKIGVMGVGRIGKRVIKRLDAFGADIYGCDTNQDKKFGKQYNVKWVTKEEMFKTCDMVTLHIPMNTANRHCVGFEEMSLMKSGAFLINTSRGPIVDELSLISLLRNRHLGGVALDVFEKEPYEGELTKFDNVIFTAHIGASASESRFRMEIGAADDCIRVLSGKKTKNAVPEDY